MMYVKKIKRKCGVRGCKNTESYAISKSREMGNSIIACKECLEEALKTIEEKYMPIAPIEPTEAITEAPAVEIPTEEESPTEAVVVPTEAKKKRKRTAEVEE